MLGRLLEQAAIGRRPESGATVADLLVQYMAVAELDSSTRETYEGYIRRTILPALGPMELRKLRGPVLDILYTRLRRCGNLACTGPGGGAAPGYEAAVQPGQTPQRDHRPARLLPGAAGLSRTGSPCDLAMIRGFAGSGGRCGAVW